MNIKHGIAVFAKPSDLPAGFIPMEIIDDESILVHFCGMESQPTQADFEALKNELEHDNEFGLVGYTDRLTFVLAPQELVDFFMENMLPDVTKEDVVGPPGLEPGTPCL